MSRNVRVDFSLAIDWSFDIFQSLSLVDITNFHTSKVSGGVLANQTAYNVSKLLDSLLQDYDNSLRPDFAGKLLNFKNINKKYPLSILLLFISFWV